jgi:hypothetical protein
MNEKIRQLAEQSGFFPVPDETEWDWEYRAENARYEKFAELIVRECYEVCKNNLVPLSEYDSDEAFKYNEGVSDCAILIKRRFGVE